MSIHTGHRQRLRERFMTEGLDHFDQLQVLELLLFYCVPRQDTNPIAHALLDRFGSFSQVLEAPASELCKVPGVGENVAAFITLLTATCRYYQVNRSTTGEIVTTVEQCGEFLLPYFCGRRNETVFLLCLDAKCKVISCKEVGEGSVNSASVPIRRIVEMALGDNASSVILAHNHPSGVAVPSVEDRYTTKKLAMSLEAVEIELVDHLVVADDDFVSMRQSGLYDPSECMLPL